MQNEKGLILQDQRDAVIVFYSKVTSSDPGHAMKEYGEMR
jgi:hypothetical protein